MTIRRSVSSKPRGMFAASNWMTAHDGEPSADMKAYVAAEGLSFRMASRERQRKAMQRRVRRCDGCRPQPMVPQGGARRAHGAEGPLCATVAQAVGKDYLDKNIRTWEAMQKVLDSGEHRPTHLRGWKPDGGR